MAGLAGCGEGGRDVVHRAGGRVVVILMAGDAARIREAVIVVDVAIRTLPRGDGVRPGQCETGAVMVERRVEPGRRVVALLAGLREIRSDVVWIRGGLEILEMAGDASRAVERVVVVHMTVGALPGRNCVGAGQREAGRGVVELAVGPERGVVAVFTGSRKAGVRYRCGCGVVVTLVAAHACGIRDVVVAVDMAVGALPRRHRMGTGQRKGGLGVVERSRLPGRRVVAQFAGLGESALYVVGIGGILKIFGVAGDAGGGRQIVVVVDVAICALPRRDRMGAGQCEVHQRVIERGRLPRDRRVALGAVLWEIGGDVVGIRCALEILQVAGNAGRTGQVVIVVDVAVGALPRRD